MIDTNSNIVPCQTSSTFNSTVNQEDRENKLARDRDREFLSLQMIVQQIKSENENLRKQLNNFKEEYDAQRLVLLRYNILLL